MASPDPNEATIPQARSLRYFFRRQWIHWTLAVLLAAAAYLLAGAELGNVGPDGRGDAWLGIGETTWFWIAVAVPILHQLLVWWVFRGQLGWGILTRWFGARDLTVWRVVFMPLLLARPVSVLGLAVADSGSLAMPRLVAIGIGAALMVPVHYGMWSVARYFGISRAVGGDHFRLSFRRMPMVREGAFRWTSNAMYGVIFLGFWGIALLAGSHVALVVAAGQHAFIWVHYYCTEKPDMALMYGAPAAAAAPA